MRKIFIVLLIFISSNILKAQVDHWETAVYSDNIWNYAIGYEAPDPDWRTLYFDDSTWEQGTGGIGFGDADDSTVISPTIALYMRISFNIEDTSKIEQALLSIDYDDGFVAYINNTEIARSNIGNDEFPSYTQGAQTNHEAQMYQGGLPEDFVISKALLNECLNEGHNILAIQIHNHNIFSSDLSSNIFLSLGINDTIHYYGDTPTWFEPPFEFVSSNLPIVFINTNGQTIQSENRIIANLGIVNNAEGQRNYITDSINDYNGLVSIEIRGSTSASFPKKSFAFETQYAQGDNNNVELMGLPSENDWILYAPYSDKSLIRNVLLYDLSNKMNRYASRTKFCEVVINGEYKGVSVLMEKIKVDQNRVDIKKIDASDLASDDITGGYIIKIDKTTGAEDGGWYSSYLTYDTEQDLYFQYHKPGSEDLQIEQKDYIKGFVDDFEAALSGEDFRNPYIGYSNFIDLNSFIDFFILNELSKNVDGYRLSTFLYKNRDSYGGKLKIGPVWDFNLAFGNANYCTGGDTEGWMWNFNNECSYDNNHVPFWWPRLLEDGSFINQVKCRWNQLRNGILHTDTIFNCIDALALTLEESQVRNFTEYPVLGQYLWPNNFIGETYAEEIGYLKSWIESRFNWLDNNMYGEGSDCESINSEFIRITEVNYHSGTDYKSGDWFELYNHSSSPINLSNWEVKDDGFFTSYIIPEGTVIDPQSYLVVCENLDFFTAVYPEVGNYVGAFNFGLGNGGDQINISDEFGYPVVNFEYMDSIPWPTGPDGGGYTLELDSNSGDVNNAENWFAGCEGGSPGTAFIPCIDSITLNINEHLSVSISPNPFINFVEISFEENIQKNISIYNAVGQEIRRMNTTSEHEIIWDGTDDQGNAVPSGIYLCNIHDGLNRYQAIKIIKQ